MKDKTENTTTPYDDVHRTNYRYPFHLFAYEQDFKVYEENPQKLNELTAVYEGIAEKLNVCEENGVIDAYTKSMIVDMSKKVLDYPTKTLWRKAQRDKLVEQVQKKLAKGKSVEEIAEAIEESVETIKSIIDVIPQQMNDELK